MPCESMQKPNQSLAQRREEVTKAVARIVSLLVSGKAKAKVGPQGAIAFDGISAEDRDGVTDNCAYRRIMSTGSALARATIAKAEQLAGRSVDRMAVGRGIHSHDGGATWHRGH